MFLVAVGLTMGTSAWADPIVVGETDNTTDWWTAFSDYYTLAPNQTLTLTFKNYSDKAENSHNWLAVVTTDADRNDTENGYVEYVVLRSDNYGWGANYASGTLTSNYNWDTFRGDMDGSDVVMTIERKGATVTINADITASDGETKYNEKFVVDCGIGTQTIRAFLTVEKSHLEINSAEISDTENAPIFATLVHTASSQCAGDASAYTSTIDAEKEHVNNSAFSGAWQAAAYADFSFTIPDGKDITEAMLIYYIYGESRRDRQAEVYYVSAGTQLDYDELATGTAKVNLTGAKIADVTFERNGVAVEKTLDVTAAVKAIYGADQGNIIFKWTGNPGGGDVAGKGADESICPTLVITTIDASSTTSYTVNFLDASDNSVIKEAVVYTAQEIGTIADATEEDKKTFYSEDGTKKYVYDSNTTAGLVADAASNFINVLFNAYEKEDYTIMAQVDGEDLVAVGTGTNFLDGSETAFFSKFATKDGDWYQAEAPYSIALDAATVNVPYTKIDDVVYCSEAEAIEGVEVMDGAFKNNMSNGFGAVLNNTKIATLEAGVYSITACVVGRANDRFVDFYKGAVDEANNILHVVSQNAGGVASAIFSLSTTTDIVGNGGYNTPSANGHSCDYILITKLPSAVTATVSDAGWATLYTPYALDFSGVTGLTAYTATLSESTVTLTAVKDVPTNTGVVLKGAEGKYDVPVIASSETAKGYLQGSAEATAWDAFAGNTLYILTMNGENAQFNPVVSGEIEAGKAFLKVADDSEVQAFTVVFADETTGIETMRNVENEKMSNAVFDLSGRRVAKAQKGVYIVNGKKVVK